jgi:hypothetical protein
MALGSGLHLHGGGNLSNDRTLAKKQWRIGETVTVIWRTAMVLKRLLVLSSFEEAEYASQELNFVSERGFVS